MRFNLTDEQWMARLSPEVYEITRRAGTERPFSGQYNELMGAGRYHCACCFAPLFESDRQYRSGCGWPSFDRSLSANVGEREDCSHAMVRMEIFCKACDAHLGHVFPDGPEKTTGIRHCVNSLAVSFRAVDKRVEALVSNLSNPALQFSEVIALIDDCFEFIPTAFNNGSQQNAAGENSGSCKVFSFAHQLGLSKEQTLQCFCEHYQSVLQAPEGADHQNIRQFMENGWDGVEFFDVALTWRG